MEKIKVGMIGTGQMGRDLIECIGAIEEYEITALCDTYGQSIDRALKMLDGKAEVYKDYREMLHKAKIDTVFIATPNCTHKDITIEALKAGKNVRCEKPMAINVRDCLEVIDAVGKYGKIMDVGLELRYSPFYSKVESLLSGDTIGQLRMMWFKEFRKPFAKKVNDWIIQKDMSGNTLVEKNCHHFDLMNWFCKSDPVSVCAFGGGDVVYKDRDVLDNAWVITEYKNGVKASLGVCMFGPEHHEMGAIGDKGKLDGYELKNEINVSYSALPERNTIQILNDKGIEKLSHNGSVYYSLLALRDSILYNRKTLTGCMVGLKSILVPIAAQKSIEEKRLVYIDELIGGI